MYCRCLPLPAVHAPCPRARGCQYYDSRMNRRLARLARLVGDFDLILRTERPRDRANSRSELLLKVASNNPLLTKRTMMDAHRCPAKPAEVIHKLLFAPVELKAQQDGKGESRSPKAAKQQALPPLREIISGIIFLSIIMICCWAYYEYCY